MGTNAKYVAVVFCLLLPATAKAQSVGQVECPRAEGYVYLYSSLTTLDVRATLQCGEQVQIVGRYDKYYAVRTLKGEIGYLPMSSLLLYKDKAGPNTPQQQPQPSARPHMPYDEPAANAPAAPSAPGAGLTLLNGTPIHLKLGKTISSASAQFGEEVELEVVEEVIVDGLRVIPKGARGIGMVTEAEPKKRLGRGGKLVFLINSVRLSDNEKAAVRSFQEGKSANTTAGAILPLASGKEMVFLQGTPFTAYVDGDVHLKRAAFEAAKNGGSRAPAHSAQNASQPQRR